MNSRGSYGFITMDLPLLTNHLTGCFRWITATPEVSNVTAEVSECSTVDVASCSRSYVLIHGVKSVSWMNEGQLRWDRMDRHCY